MKAFFAIGNRRLFRKRPIDIVRAWARKDPDNLVLLVVVAILLVGVFFHGLPHAIEHSPLLAKISRFG